MHKLLPLFILTAALAWPRGAARAQVAPDLVDRSGGDSARASPNPDGNATPRDADRPRGGAAAMDDGGRRRLSVNRRLWRTGAVASFGYHHTDDADPWGPPATGLAAQGRFAPPRGSVGATVSFAFR